MIRNLDTFNAWQPAGFDGQFHWDFLKGAFGPSIMPMDFDGVVERNGRFLVKETKNKGVAIPYGQKRSLKAAVRTGFFTVMVIYGKSAEEITSFEIWHGEIEKSVDPANAQSVYDQCAQWYEWTNRLPLPVYPEQLQGMVDALRTENSHLRESLNKANSKIQVLTEYADRLERSFRLEPPPKKKPVARKSMALSLGLMR